MKSEPYNYDNWFDFAILEEQANDADPETVLEVYKRATAITPPTTQDKRLWKRYIYLYLNWAVYAEKIGNDAAPIYEEIIKKIPHQQFTFGKVWIQLAMYYLRQGNLDKARKTFGLAIGKAPRPSIFTAYTNLEMQLVEIDRCRKIQEKFLETFPNSTKAWTSYAQFEGALGETERARAIF